MCGLNDLILRRIGALSRMIQTVSDHKFRQFGLQKNQFIYLTRIAEHPGIGLAELSNLLRVDKASTTKTVQKLEALGYVRRTPDDQDRRAFRLTLTPAAQPLYKTILAEENLELALAFSGFSPEEQALTNDLIARMNQNLEGTWKRAKSGREPS